MVKYAFDSGMKTVEIAWDTLMEAFENNNMPEEIEVPATALFKDPDYCDLIRHVAHCLLPFF